MWIKKDRKYDGNVDKERQTVGLKDGKIERPPRCNNKNVIKQDLFYVTIYLCWLGNSRKC